MTRAARIVVALVSVSMTTSGLVGCSGGAAASRPPAPQVTVRAKDFRLTLSETRWPTGRLSVRFENDGPDTHELLVFAAPDNSADAMPMRIDGQTVDEESPLLHAVIDERGTPAGGAQTVTVDLAPGHYVALCNMNGHYMAGMWQDVTVG